MSYVQHKVSEVESVNVHTIETSKFKTTTIVMQIQRPIEEASVTKRALLAQVLKSGTKSLPSTVHIHRQLEDLYGATLSSDVQKKGEQQIISIRMDIANEKFLSDSPPLLEKAIQFISDILLQPATDQENSFSHEIVEKEKRVLKQQIASIYDDKMRFANKRLIEEMYRGERFGLHAYGKAEEVDGISATDLFDYYQQVIANDPIDLYIIGDVVSNEVTSLVSKHLAFPGKRQVQSSSQKDRSEVKEKKEENVVFDEQDIKQGKLHIGFRTNIVYGDPDYYALQVFNGIFGGFSHSKLFTNVREKESLAYYAVSQVESQIGAMFVMSGIEFKNYEKAVEIIKQQFKSMKEGSFTEGELGQTKAMLKNQILEAIDNPIGVVEVLFHNALSQKNSTIEETLARIDEVSKDDIVNAGNKIKLDTIYFLKGVNL